MSAGWLVVVCAYGRIGRHTRANLAAMNISVDEYVAAIAAEARARVYEQLDRDQRMLDELLRPADVESYSIALYGARDRMPMQSLKLLWPTLLTNATLKRLVAAGGTCNFGHTDTRCRSSTGCSTFTTSLPAGHFGFAARTTAASIVGAQPKATAGLR